MQHKTGLRVLAIGSDNTIWDGHDNPTLNRQGEYAKRCDKFVMICYTGTGYNPLNPSDNFFIFPTNSRSKHLFIFDAMRLGLRLIRRFSINVIVVQDTFFFGFVGLILKWMTYAHLIVHYHSGFWTNPYWMKEKKINLFLARLGKLISKRADVIRTVSSDIRRDLILCGMNSTRVFYATPPVEPSAFLGKDVQKEKEIFNRFNLNPDRTLIFIGRFSKEKNIPMLLESICELASRYNDIKLVMIGAGPEENAILIMINNLALGDNIIMPGRVDNKQLRDYIRVSLALVVSSFYEGTSKVIKEAAISGRPTITTMTSGVSDTIREGETGLIVPVGDKRAMVMAMDTLLSNPGKARKMGEKAKEYILEKFDYQKDINRIVEVWRYAANLKGN